MSRQANTALRIDAHVTQHGPIGLPKSLVFTLSGQVKHTARGGITRTRILTGADITLITNAGGAASLAAGVKLLDFPTGRVCPLASRIRGRIEATGSNTTSGELGLGSVVASGAAAVLGGTATFEDILEGAFPVLGAKTAGATAAAQTFANAYRGAVGASDFSGAVDLYINAAAAFAGNGTLVLRSGAVIDLWHIFLTPSSDA